MNLEQLLADTARTDDVEVVIGDQKVRLGDLRSYAKAKADAEAAARRELEVKGREYADAKAKAEKLAKDSLALFEESTKNIAERNRTAEARTGDIDWDTDPVYSPVHKRFLTEAEKMTKLEAEIKALKEALGAGFKFVTEDYNERRWNALPKDIRPKDKTWRDFLADAEKQNIRDSHGLFDPVEAFNRATAAERRTAELKAAEERGAKAAEERLRQAQLTRPGGTPQVPRPGDKPKFKDLNEAMAAAAQDPEILRIASGEVQ